MFVKTGDKVKVISGKDKGKEGTIIKAMPKVRPGVESGKFRRIVLNYD